MNFLNNDALVRGATLIDFASARSGYEMDFDIHDLIGLVAAYLGTGRYPNSMETDLARWLDPRTARRAMETFEFFEDSDGKGLWEKGPAIEDVRFTNKKLDKMYPSVNQVHEREFGKR